MATSDKFTDSLKQWLKKIESKESEDAIIVVALRVLRTNADWCVKYTLSFLIKNLPSRLEHVKAFNELFLWALGVVSSKNLVLNFIWNYTVILYKSTDLWRDLMTLTPAMAFEGSDISQQNSRMHFNLTKYLASTYYFLSRSGYCDLGKLEVILRNFSTLLKVSVGNSAEFLVDLREVFDRKYRYGQSLIEIDKEAGMTFLRDVLRVMEQELEEKDILEDMFVLKSDLLEILLNFELRNDIHDQKLSRKLMEMWKKSTDDIEMQCVDVFSALCDVLAKRDVKGMEKACNAYQWQVESLGGRVKQPLVVDTFATIALILERHVEKKMEYLSVGASMSIIRAINTQISIQTENRKDFCKACSNTDSKKHCIVTLISVALNLFRDLISKSTEVPIIACEALVGIIRHNFYILGRFKCSKKDFLMENSMRNVYNTFLMYKQKNSQQYVLKVMEMLLETAQKFTFDYPYRQNIVKFLLNFYIKEQDIRQTLNVGVVDLLLLIERENPSFEKISAHIKAYLHYSLYELREISPTNLVDVIEGESFKWYGPKVKFDACKLLLAQVASYDVIASKSLFLCAINKLRKITDDPKILTEALLCLPESFYSDFQGVFRSLFRLLSSEKSYPDQSLHKAFLYYGNFVLEFDEWKKPFVKEKVTEKEIIDQQWSILERINVEEMQKFVVMIQKSVVYFEKFAQDSPETHRQIKYVLKTMKCLALSAKLHGLVRDSVIVYDLMYQIATKINHKEMIVISLSSIFFYSTVYEELKSSDDIVNQLAADQSDLISEALRNLHKEKQEAPIINCLLNYALFCATKGSVAVACRYLSAAFSKIQSLESLKHLELHFLAIEYLIAIKYSEKCAISHMNFMPQITQVIKSSVNHVGREIFYLLPLEIIRQLVDYSVVRFDCDGVNTYVLTMMRYFLMTGMMLQVADTLLLSAQVDLAEEKVENCKSKLYYFMKILHLHKLKFGFWVESWGKIQPKDAKALVQTRWVDVEFARKMFLDHPVDCGCLLCLQSKLEPVFRKMILFFVWILFIEKQFDKTLEIYKAIPTADPRKSGATSLEPYEVKTKGFIVNSLVNMGEVEKGLKECLKSREMCESMRGHRTAFRQGFEVQIASLEYSMNKPLKSPVESERRSRYCSVAPVAKVEFERRLEKCSSESGGSECGKSPLERNLDAKFKGKVTGTGVENRPATRRGRPAKEETVAKPKRAPPKTERKSTRSTKKL